MRRLETAALAVIAMSTASVIAIAQTAAPGSTGAASSSSSAQLGNVECQQVWTQINPQAKPSVSGSDAQAHVTDLKKVDTNGDNMISSQEFTSACQQGFVKHASAGSGSSGSSGSSSGTSGTSSSSGAGSSGSGSSSSPTR